ncbi:hypothetical protein H4R33_000519 [Dimargaris cristalligena]|uniref:LITAF domain-containing protein n=1 Tax=Dimargaris cristalligena TaxID=215637 RepID=A0A4P9ZQL7_9FUNG|nr:hypothetical protein H4R33_000519 [Dimargaris cristalligena]RKP34932.1 hypothetical protein BJ085DRAFT_27821 [Dimargaris cristalligena]|eukprot:RKP34932.1 hypothetical protein BJ085DRAFT_27821 [Dimargaris cristalligena]
MPHNNHPGQPYESATMSAAGPTSVSSFFDPRKSRSLGYNAVPHGGSAFTTSHRPSLPALSPSPTAQTSLPPPYLQTARPPTNPMTPGTPLTAVLTAMPPPPIHTIPAPAYSAGTHHDAHHDSMEDYDNVLLENVPDKSRIGGAGRGGEPNAPDTSSRPWTWIRRWTFSPQPLVLGEGGANNREAGSDQPLGVEGGAVTNPRSAHPASLLPGEPSSSSKHQPISTHCYKCEKRVTSLVRYRNGRKVGLVALLLGVTCLPFVWVPFVTKSFKDEIHYCGICMTELGRIPA